jgi:hypothetical protein
LFDYIAPITPQTRVDTLDIDRDGDLDSLYILDDTLYIKYNHTSTMNKILDTTLLTKSISPSDLPPYVPNYFHEDISTPTHLSYTFVPASRDEREWRMEFYDRYTEWDRVDVR